MGDFNETMWQYEHFSETPRPERQMMDFREVLSHCDLHVLGFAGLPWTYNNNQGGRRNVRVHLDRGVANTDWSFRFPHANVSHLLSTSSDHKALLLKLERTCKGAHQNKPFRYEIMWEREADMQAVIERSWLGKNRGSDLGALSKSLETVTNDLKKWSSQHFGNVTRRIEELKRELERLEWEDPIHNRDKILEAKRELDDVLYKEEMMWLQRSRINWLREGDRNTKYFHRKAMWRAKKNKIRRLKWDDGSWCLDEIEMQGMAESYFKSLFMKDHSIIPDDIVDLFEPKVTNDLNSELCKPFSPEEIADALFQIGPLKAPGPDGLPARFFSVIGF
jgi:hypothetical protein